MSNESLHVNLKLMIFQLTTSLPESSVAGHGFLCFLYHVHFVAFMCQVRYFSSCQQINYFMTSILTVFESVALVF